MDGIYEEGSFMKEKYRVLWDKVDGLSFSETCDWLGIPISKNSIHCPAPYHEDRDPSCKIKDDRFCHCFACGFGAGPLKLIMTVKELTKWEALQFINQHTKVLIPMEENAGEKVCLSHWELACLGLKENPLYPFTQRIAGQDGSSHTEYTAISRSEAYWLINDKFIECCPTEKHFEERFRSYVRGVLDEAMHGKKFISPADEPWKYPDRERFQNAMKMHQIKMDKYVWLRTGLRYDVLLEWHLEGRTSLVEAAIRKRGKQCYAELEKKIDAIIHLLEEEEAYDRESCPAVAR